MTYSSCCGKSRYSMAEELNEQKANDFSMYENSLGGSNYTAGLNKVAESYMSVPACGKYKSVNNLML